MIKIINVRDDSSLSKIALGPVSVEISRHAYDRANIKGIQLSSRLDIVKGSVVEVEVNQYNQVVKSIVRLGYNNRQDIVYVIVPHKYKRGTFLAKTVWLNNKEDNHDISKYKTDRAKCYQRKKQMLSQD